MAPAQPQQVARLLRAPLAPLGHMVDVQRPPVLPSSRAASRVLTMPDGRHRGAGEHMPPRGVPTRAASAGLFRDRPEPASLHRIRRA